MVKAEDFKNPPAKCRIKPFWFWNGELTREEIHRQIQEMADKGLGGMYICARQGMTVPYMSEKWLELVKFACNEAKKAGLEAWLYDEYPYPSGMGGGEVLLEHPEAEHKILKHKRVCLKDGGQVREELGWGRVLYAKAFRVGVSGETIWESCLDLEASVGILQTEKLYQQTGLTKYNNKRFFSYGPKKVLEVVLPPGEWRIEIYTEESLGDFKYYGGFFDPCSKEAVQSFLRCTHEKYSQTNGEEFGKSVFGMFSDEVGLLSPIPWSRLLPEAFEKRNGYSILDCLPALHDCTWKDAYRIRFDLYETVHYLFCESYHHQVADWCKKHHLLYATEVPSMRNGTQRYSDVVGGDTAHEKLGKSLEWIYDEYLHNYRSNAKAVSSLARQLNKPYAMIESFHSVGWTMTLQDAKWMIDRLGSSGINLYNFHAFYYTIQDITKHDAPPSQFLQNPYWKYYRKLADYVGRMGTVISGTRADISIAVLDPVSALWTLLGNPFNGFEYQGESKEEREVCERLRDGWVEVCKSLLFAQLDYDHLDAQILEEAQVKEGKIYIGQAAYSVVILPECHCMEIAARRKLEEFEEQGGLLVAIGGLPYISLDKEEDDQTAAERWKRLFERKNAVRLWGKTELLADTCRKRIQETFCVRVEQGDPHTVIAVTRLDGQGGAFVFLANQGGEAVSCQLRAGQWDETEIWQYDMETGEIASLGSFGREGILVRLEPFESRLLRGESVGKGICLARCPGIEGMGTELQISMDGDWDCRPESRNICRFGQIELSLDRKKWVSTETKTFLEQCIQTKLLEGGRLRAEGAFGVPKRLEPAYPIDCWYRAEFEIEEMPKELELLMDRETVSGSFEIQVNGWPLKGTWKSVRVNDQNNQSQDILRFVRTGKNEILFHVQAEKDEDGLRDPFYFIGTFGIKLNPTERSPKLTRMPARTNPDGPFPKGFPFYSGTMEYTRLISREELFSGSFKQEGEEVSVKLDFKNPGYDCVELELNGKDLGVKAYAPYRWNCVNSDIREGANRVTVRVTNTLANMLDGMYFDYKEHCLREMTEEEAEG